MLIIGFLILLALPLVHAGEGDYGAGPYGTGVYGTGEIVVKDVGGGGGGGRPRITPELNVTIDPTEINLDLAVNTNKEQIINVTNLGDNKVTVQIRQRNLGDMVLLRNTSLELEQGESKDLSVIFIAFNETGIFTGKIIIGNKQVLVSLNVKTKLLLFDSNIVVLNKNYRVKQGEELRTRVSLIPKGDKERLDVTLNYVIKDFEGKVYLTKSETLLVEEEIGFEISFDTGMLPAGEYVVGLELVYPGGVAPSTAHFEVVETKKEPLAPPSREIPLRTLAIIGAVGLFVIVLIVTHYLTKKRKKKELPPPSEPEPKAPEPAPEMPKPEEKPPEDLELPPPPEPGEIVPPMLFEVPDIAPPPEVGLKKNISEEPEESYDTKELRIKRIAELASNMRRMLTDGQLDAAEDALLRIKRHCQQIGKKALLGPLEYELKLLEADLKLARLR